MDDSISRQATIIQLSHNKIGDDDCDVIVQRDIETIKQLPLTEPEIIHCRDCIHWKSKEYVGNNDIHTLDLASLPCKNWLTAGDWYCGSAERQEE
jgi:lipopolysaccharide biosynthesis glycosyltransferase